jgi:hypothetical protein
MNSFEPNPKSAAYITFSSNLLFRLFSLFETMSLKKKKTN